MTNDHTVAVMEEQYFVVMSPGLEPPMELLVLDRIKTFEERKITWHYLYKKRHCFHPQRKFLQSYCVFHHKETQVIPGPFLAWPTLRRSVAILIIAK
jgi:hypothetical protein